MDFIWIGWAAKAIVIIWAINEFSGYRKKLKNMARDIGSLKNDIRRTDKRIRHWSREHEENIDRLKLASFLMLQNKTRDATDILSGRLSHSAIRSEMLELRRAIANGGKIDPVWVIEETRTKEDF